MVIRKDYLGDVPRSSSETFFRNAKFWKEGDGEAPPVFNVDGITYMHIKEGGVQLVATTRANLSPSFVLEFLRRICTIVKDYCGFLSEDAIRKNVVLIYELLDEVVDYGFPQNTATEALKQFVVNEPTVVTPAFYQAKPLFSLSKGPTGVFKSVLETNRTDGKRRDEIFVDVVERITWCVRGGVFRVFVCMRGMCTTGAALAVLGLPAVIGCLPYSSQTRRLYVHGRMHCLSH